MRAQSSSWSAASRGLLSAWLILTLPGAARAAEPDPARRRRLAETFAAEAAAQQSQAWAIARRDGWAPKGPGYELMAIRDGRVFMRHTANRDAALSSAADVTYAPPYELSGAGITVGVWDEGLIRPTHVEFGGRVTPRDTGVVNEHATHVGGTLGAGGTNAAARGLAPAVLLDTYDWAGDLAEVTAVARMIPDESGALPLSNHSYDYNTGWSLDEFPQRWYGVWGAREDVGFGMYAWSARNLDVLAWNAPYYLQVRSAGNDRGDFAPSPGIPFLYWNGFFWASAAYDPLVHPYADNWDQGGYDTLPYEQNAKDVLVVGAVHDAVVGGSRAVTAAVMTSFSSWGPTDDGRVKPDLVANGFALYTTSGSGDDGYAFEGGSSIAAPVVSGGLALLLELRARVLPAFPFRASTLKALVLHTADDLEASGPDYRTGWGLLNVQAAADHLLAHAADRTRCDIREDMVVSGAVSRVYYYVADGTGAVRVTLCWTDPPGPENTDYNVLDDRTPRLVHDLDVRLVTPAAATLLPFTLNPDAPTNLAAAGDNDVDNVEQIRAPSAGPGRYEVRVEVEGALAQTQQWFSLVVSGLKRADEIRGIVPSAEGGAPYWNSSSGIVYTVDRALAPRVPLTWSPAGTVTAVADVTTFVEPAPGPSNRWYRLRLQP